MIKGVIIDDEKPSIEAISQILGEFCPDVQVLGSTSSPSEGIKLINEVKPDVVFLDIEMPVLNGFDVLESIPDKNFEVIFITAYDHYAIKAFKVNAIDYILKPVNVKEIIQAVNKVKEKISTDENSSDKYNDLINQLQNSKSPRIQLSVQNGVELVQESDIIRILADGRYSRVFLNTKKSIFVTKTLKELEKELHTPPFLRVHKSHVVNINYVKKYNLVSSFQLELVDGTIVDVSRRKKDEFIEFMTQL